MPPAQKAAILAAVHAGFLYLMIHGVAFALGKPVESWAFATALAFGALVEAKRATASGEEKRKPKSAGKPRPRAEP